MVLAFWVCLTFLRVAPQIQNYPSFAFEKEDDMVTALAQGNNSKQQKDNKKTTSTPKSMQKQDGTMRDHPTERPEYFVIEALHRPFIHKTHLEPSKETLAGNL